MALIDIGSLKNPIPPDRFSLFELGFRPFFLGAGFAAIGLMLWWLGILLGVVPGSSYYGVFAWHPHEMVFGFAVAVIGGFLLTAARNWTGVQTLKGPALAVLAGIWLLGRILPLLAEIIPSWLIALVDIAFLPLLAISLASVMLRANKLPQLIFVAILMTMFAANVMIHLQLLGITDSGSRLGMSLAINAVVLVIIVMAGRVLPMFTERGAPGAMPRKWPWLEKVAISSVVILLIVELVYPSVWLVALVAGVAALAHGLRLWGLYSRLVWSVPLLWVLHLGYAWMVLGFGLKALAMLELVQPAIAAHAIVASISVLSLGMMSRVSLGHTGRPLVAASAMAWAFGLLNLGMCFRVFLPLFAPDLALQATVLSAMMWMSAFLIFVIVYVPILIRARVDGQPG